jgi:hypothetical protein
MKKLRLKESCTQYSVGRDRYGDIKMTAIGTLLCLYRNIEHIQRDVNFREEAHIIGLFWFDASATVKIGDVIGYNNQLFRIENVVTAKELLTSNAVHFLKCQVSIYRSIS